jgi:hypothetical protein
MNGGAFVLKFEKDKADKIWEDIVLGFLGKNVGECGLINGVRYKVKKEILSVEIWISDVRNEEDL